MENFYRNFQNKPALLALVAEFDGCNTRWYTEICPKVSAYIRWKWVFARLLACHCAVKARMRARDMLYEGEYVKNSVVWALMTARNFCEIQFIQKLLVHISSDCDPDLVGLDVPPAKEFELRCHFPRKINIVLDAYLVNIEHYKIDFV